MITALFVTRYLFVMLKSKSHQRWPFQNLTFYLSNEILRDKSLEDHQFFLNSSNHSALPPYWLHRLPQVHGLLSDYGRSNLMRCKRHFLSVPRGTQMSSNISVLSSYCNFLTIYVDSKSCGHILSKKKDCLIRTRFRV